MATAHPPKTGGEAAPAPRIKDGGYPPAGVPGEVGLCFFVFVCGACTTHRNTHCTTATRHDQGFLHPLCEAFQSANNEPARHPPSGADCRWRRRTPKTSGCEQRGLALETLPRACPELNPAERFFEELRNELSNRIFQTRSQLENFLCQRLKYYFDHPEALVQRCHYSYRQNACENYPYNLF